MSSQSRHVYTREERAILETSYTRQSHPDINEKERLAKLLNCNIIQISNWFQNHRRRQKKQIKSITPITSTTVNTISSNSPIYQPPCVYHQPQWSYNNVSTTDNSSYCYYYYYCPSSTYQCVYSPEPASTQTMYLDPFVAYEQ